MGNTQTTPAIINVGEELPPMPSASGPKATPKATAARPAHVGKAVIDDSRKRRRVSAERFAVLNGFIDVTMATLGRNEIAVWLVLYRDTKKTGTARTGQTDIARRAGMAVRTVRRAVGKLRHCGLVALVQRGSQTSGPSVYRVYSLATPSAKGTSSCPVTRGQTSAKGADKLVSSFP